MLKKKFPKIFILLFFVSFNSFSQQEDFSALLIPNEIKQNANAVVRDNSLEVIVEDVDELVVKTRMVVTVLNKLGQVDAKIAEHYDKDTKIKNLSAKIYDAFGQEIKKYRERDFLDVSAVPGGTLYSDDRVKYVEYIPISYPYTVVFESEYKTQTTGFIPNWFPINEYHVSVEKSTYTFKNPKEIPFRYKESNFKGFNIKKTFSTSEITYTLQNQEALKYEYSTVAYRKLLPKVLISLNKSTLKGVYGEYTNWQEFGKWMHQMLILGRDELGQETKFKLLSLVKDLEDPIEKAKIVYKFMQDKTRYISVQVGIGGWEPIAADKVDQVGYGDCKGLTNYTKALLDVVGVKSYYTVVYADEKRDIDKDFASIQGNHIILNIPNKGNDIWLECTSQSMPFGFLGDFTEDRNVLVITPEGGIIKKTPAYKDESNLQITKAKIVLENDGNLTAKVSRVSKGIQYDNKIRIENYSEDELLKHYKSRVWSYNNNLTINSIDLTNDKDSIVFKEKLDVKIKDYASLQNQQYLFRVNIFNTIDNVPKRYRNRILPFEILSGYKDVEDYTISIPEGYYINTLPKPTKISSKFGSYNSKIVSLDKKTLIYKRTIIIKNGVHAKEEYDNYREFCRTIARIENQRIAITKL